VPSPERVWQALIVVILSVIGTLPLNAASAAPAPPTIYLTFDADMTPGMLRQQHAGRVKAWYDPAIVDFLHANGVAATFFVAGLFAETYPELVGRISRDPLFTIGNHSYLHAAFEKPCYGLAVLHSDEEKAEDIAKAESVLTRIAGRAPSRFRYPGLCHAPRDDEEVRNAGLVVDVPTILGGDAFNRNAPAIAREVLRRAKDGGIVVLHVGGPNAPATLEALKVLVPALRAKGYVFRAE
jgi:peptidoglycan/xylan/chitin deacetylase (PgdA/CDA1 family)